MSATTRRLAWSIRRELWENRSIVIGPLIAAAVVMLGVLIGTRDAARTTRAIAALDPALQADALAKPFIHATIPIFFTMLLVGIVYCLGTLYAERRDRSILFWKSLPVSDADTVLAKAAIPFAILPLIAFAAILATQLVMLLLDIAALTLNGVGAGILWSQLPFLQLQICFLYGLVIMALWFAPITAWLILVSAWARRTPFLWAISPLALCVLEGLAFHTTHLARAFWHRLAGAGGAAFADTGTIDRVNQLAPLQFLATPDLWLGLAFAAACLAVCVWLRRTREPM